LWVHQFDAPDLDQVLAHHRFSNLRRLSVIVREGRTLFTPVILASMPLASARGILAYFCPDSIGQLV
jgi:hypothetical protein